MNVKEYVQQLISACNDDPAIMLRVACRMNVAAAELRAFAERRRYGPDNLKKTMDQRIRSLVHPLSDN